MEEVNLILLIKELLMLMKIEKIWLLKEDMKGALLKEIEEVLAVI